MMHSALKNKDSLLQCLNSTLLKLLSFGIRNDHENNLYQLLIQQQKKFVGVIANTLWHTTIAHLFVKYNIIKVVSTYNYRQLLIAVQFQIAPLLIFIYQNVQNTAHLLQAKLGSPWNYTGRTQFSDYHPSLNDLHNKNIKCMIKRKANKK